MFDNLNKYNIILASNSPRRKELLQRLGLVFEVKTLPNLDESYPACLNGERIARYIATKKAEAYKQTMQHNDMLITADTIVCAPNGVILGKPHKREEAVKMLHSLSGNVHHVITGVTITTANKSEVFAATTSVRFSHLTDSEINYYITHYHPFDKAGSYGIQEWLGLIAVEEIHGSFFNVMGLPIQHLYEKLKSF